MSDSEPKTPSQEPTEHLYPTYIEYIYGDEKPNEITELNALLQDVIRKGINQFLTKEELADITVDNRDKDAWTKRRTEKDINGVHVESKYDQLGAESSHLLKLTYKDYRVTFTDSQDPDINYYNRSVAYAKLGGIGEDGTRDVLESDSISIRWNAVELKDKNAPGRKTNESIPGVYNEEAQARVENVLEIAKSVYSQAMEN